MLSKSDFQLKDKRLVVESWSLHASCCFLRQESDELHGLVKLLDF